MRGYGKIHLETLKGFHLIFPIKNGIIILRNEMGFPMEIPNEKME